MTGERATSRSHPFLEPSVPAIVILVLGRLFLAGAFVASQSEGANLGDDVARFHEIAHTEGTPWQDFDVEYAPLEAIVIELVGRGTLAYTGRAIVVLAVFADLTAAAAIGFGWGRSAAGRYLLLGLPLLTFIYFRLDAVPVALAASGLALAKRDREVQGGISLAAGILMKFWPVVVAPALILQRRRRAFTAAAVSTVIGLTAWVTFAGLSGASQVTTFRGATGWHVESVIGSVVWIVTGADAVIEQGAARVGTVPGALLAALAVCAVLTEVAIWSRARSFGGDPVGAPSVTSVAALLMFSPLFSPQYALWLTPFVAVAVAEGAGRSLALPGAAVVFITGVISAMRIVQTALSVDVQQMLLLVRNGAVIGVVVWWFVASGRTSTISADATLARRLTADR